MIGRVVLLATLAIAVATTAVAADRDALTGTYRIAGATLIDPPPDEPSNSHLYVELTGAAARDLYASIPAAPKADACAGRGARMKTAGDMQCTQYAGGQRHRCWFGIDLRKQTVTRGVVC